MLCIKLLPFPLITWEDLFTTI